MSDEAGGQGLVVDPAKHEADTNFGKWDKWYETLDASQPGKMYGDAITYRLAAAFLAGCEEVEDWGCGRGAFREFCPGRYIGVDGSKTPYAEKIAELTSYRTKADGIMLRHVLEHNYNWPRILDNAVASFRKRLCIVIFTPFSDTTRELRHNRKSGVDCPDLSLSTADIEARLTGLKFKLMANLKSASQYHVEHVYFVWRPEPKGFWAKLRALFLG